MHTTLYINISTSENGLKLKCYFHVTMATACWLFNTTAQILSRTCIYGYIGGICYK